MSQQIWKFKLSAGFTRGQEIISMPKDAVLIDVQWQKETGSIVIWAEIDTNFASTEERTFALIWTGEDLFEGKDGSSLDHLRTIQAVGGLIIHVFEVV